MYDRKVLPVVQKRLREKNFSIHQKNKETENQKMMKQTSLKSLAILNDIRNESNTKSSISIYKPKNIELTELIYIDSNDRDTEKWKHPNHFSIDLTAINNFTNISFVITSSIY